MDTLTQPATFEETDYWNANTSDNASYQVKATRLTDLSDKCLVSIFKWIPFNNLDNIIEFSPKWDKLVQENIPVEIHLSDIGFRIAMHYFYGHEDLPKYRIKVIHSRILDEPLPDLKSPEDLHILDFSTHTELATYKHLIGNAVNLQELYFTYGSLLGQPLSEVDISLQKLKLLYIADREVVGKTLDGTQQSMLPGNIKGFLSKRFPSIKKLSVYTEANRKQTIEYAKALLHFIQRHSDTLKVVKFIVVTTSIFNKNQGDQNQVSDLVEFEDEEFNLEKLALTKLKEVDVNFGEKFFCGLEQWRWILQNQNKLSHLTLGAEIPLCHKIYEAPVTFSGSNLVTVQIGILVFDQSVGTSAEERRLPFDCSIFENCVNLKMLVLNGPPMNVNDERTPGKELLNLNKLPAALFALAIENIFLETRQIAELVRGVMKKERTLDKLSLQNIGTSTGYGVSLAMLDCWLTSQVMQEIIVKKGMNGDESRLHEYEHLIKFGAMSPIAKCSVHAYFYPNFMEYRKPAEYIPHQEQRLNMPFPFM